jgi:hypothetical protein
MQYVRKKIYNAKRAKLPPLPKNMADTHEALDSISVKTTKQDQFLLANDKENNIVIFSCFVNLHFLCDADVILMDGTFQYACQHFYQFFTLHGFKNGLYVPVVFALLPNKTVHTYSKLFEHINIECSKF